MPAANQTQAHTKADRDRDTKLESKQRVDFQATANPLGASPTRGTESHLKLCGC